MDLTLVSVDEIVAENTKLKSDMVKMISKMKNIEVENARLKAVARASVDASALMFRESIFQKQRAESLQQLNQDVALVST